jgi:nitrogen fixation protein NifU and related proteins
MAEPLGLYNPIVIDHFTHPRNMGEMKDPDGVGEATNPVCGDTLRLFIRVKDDRVTESTFLTVGCVAAIAASSMATELLTGKTLEEALRITDQDVAHALGGVPAAKIHCSVLAEKALSAAVSDYRRRKGA